MPEGDDVWRAARRLRALDGQQLTRTDFRTPRHATTDFKGARVVTTVSRGKHLLTRLDNGVTVHSHLRMEGAWVVHPLRTRWPKPAHTARIVLATPSLEAVGFQVVYDVLPTDRESEAVGHLGPDLLGPDWDPEEALRRLRAGPDVPLAVALLDQRNLAGVGNVYKCELCYLAGVDPRTPVGAVDDKLPRVVALAKELLEANKDRQRNTTGGRGPGQTTWVYRRRGPCLRCGTPIAYAEIGPEGHPEGRERATWWCPRCQPAVG